jgi:hypothetical protein
MANNIYLFVCHLAYSFPCSAMMMHLMPASPIQQTTKYYAHYIVCDECALRLAVDLFPFENRALSCVYANRVVRKPEKRNERALRCRKRRVSSL